MTSYGLIGNPVEHSFSEEYFTKKFQREGIKSNYKTFQLGDISEFQNLLEKEKDLKGLNVTLPFKEKIIPFLDEVEQQAQIIGAVNTIAFKDKKWVGYNTDCFGFMKSLFPLLEKQHQEALILGTGGAAKAVAQALRSLGIDFKFVSRNPIDKNQLSYKELTKDTISEHFLIVNCTPLGTSPKVKESPKIPYSSLTEKHLLYDLTYNPAITQFLAKGQMHGCKIFNGQKMLEYQAEQSWKIWNEV